VLTNPKFANPQSRGHLKDIIVNRIKQRVAARRGPVTPPFELEYRHVFVLPTKFGWGFALMLVFMALGGLNFNNNMALMLVFLLATIAQLTTLITYRNLSGLKLDRILSEPVFCGEPAHFRVYISNGSEHQRFAVQAGFKEPQDCGDFSLNSCKPLLLKCQTLSRGWLEMPSFRLETRFPMGFFKAWAWIFPENRCLVYPSPAKKAPPLPRTGQGHAGAATKGDGDEVHGLRKYQSGDSFQRVAWRASARHDELYSVEMESPREEACELDWDLLKGSDIETRLSILTAWVIAADHKQLSYSLKLPDEYVSIGNGTDQRARCLEKLALYLK
jgi:uncharacterized protein (DUF58 family)